ncbi:MAG: 5-histidylcysteine sulfoxide synthase [Epsilonproteobacteria bacterium]|nr:5-histidylcysteine sulfoxide synthase [Campylobacterota bacterium]
MREISIYPPLLGGEDVEQKRQEISDYFHNTFTLFEKLFELLKDDSVFYKKSEPTRHPMIFYFGHTAVFYINKLYMMGLLKERINPHFESIFAVGVDEMSWDDLEGSRYSWPKVDEVREYRTLVRKVVNDFIANLDFTLPITWDDAMWIILMGIEHERIHIETSSVLHRQMPLSFITQKSEFAVCEDLSDAPKNEMVSVEARHVKLGKERTHNLYGWDNEYGVYEEDVLAFSASKYLVSNAEYMPFVEDGGYENEAFWCEEGRKFLAIRGAKHPVFWVQNGKEWRYRAYDREISMPLSWPVEVNALEAAAFCRYKSQKDGIEYTLPSEAEYMALYEDAALGDLPLDSHANINFAHGFGSCAVNRFMFGEFGDIIGNVWQWSRTPIFAFEGFEVHRAYDDFTTPTYDDKHGLILGSSWASSGNLIMKHSRYAFRRHFYQHAGFRYVISHAEFDPAPNSKTGMDADVARDIVFRYSTEIFGEIAQMAQGYANSHAKILEMGCGSGRGAFELAKYFTQVEALDASARFIDAAVKLQNGEVLACENREYSLANLGLEANAHKIDFWQGDMNNLKPNFGGYDAIVLVNLKERYVSPERFADELKVRLVQGGLFISLSPKEHPLHMPKGFGTLEQKEIDGYILEAWRFDGV